MSLTPEYTINGSFGEVWDESGNWLANLQEVTFRVAIDRRDVMRSGTRRMGYKAMGTTGEGTIRGFKVTSQFLMRVVPMMQSDTARQFVGQLLVKLEDPEALGVERVLLKSVKFWEYGGGWQVNELVEEEIPFTFEDISVPTQIRGNMLLPRTPAAAG
jgi:hypothetical protein